MPLPRTYFCTHICFSYSSLFIPAVHTEHVWTIRGHCYTHSYIINTQTWRLSSPLCFPEAEKPRVHSYGTSTNCTERHLRCQSNLRFHLNIPESRNPVLIQSQSSSVQTAAALISFLFHTQHKWSLKPTARRRKSSVTGNSSRVALCALTDKWIRSSKGLSGDMLTWTGLPRLLSRHRKQKRSTMLLPSFRNIAQLLLRRSGWHLLSVYLKAVSEIAFFCSMSCVSN